MLWELAGPVEPLALRFCLGERFLALLTLSVFILELEEGDCCFSTRVSCDGLARCVCKIRFYCIFYVRSL